MAEKIGGKHCTPLPYLFFVHFPEKSPSFGRSKRKYLVAEHTRFSLTLFSKIALSVSQWKCFTPAFYQCPSSWISDLP